MKRSKCLLIAAILGTVYLIYLFTYFGSSLNSTASDAETIGTGLATLMVMPHMITVGIAVVFNWLGFIFKFRWSALVAGILYAVALVLFMMYFMFVVVEMILCFVGFAKMKQKDA